jgi:hypothetical protein
MPDQAHLAELQRAGFVRKRLRGGYMLTRRGTWYLNNVIRRDEVLSAEALKHQERRGEMTKDEDRETLVELAMHAWERDKANEAEALADLRAQGFDMVEALRDWRGRGGKSNA